MFSTLAQLSLISASLYGFAVYYHQIMHEVETIAYHFSFLLP